MSQLPVIGMMIGDPAGVGPEVCVRTAAAPELAGVCQTVLIGDLGVVRRAAVVCGLNLRFEPVSDPSQQLPAGVIGVVDSGGFDVERCEIGKASADSGNAVLRWMARGEPSPTSSRPDTGHSAGGRSAAGKAKSFMGTMLAAFQRGWTS